MSTGAVLGTVAAVSVAAAAGLVVYNRLQSDDDDLHTRPEGEPAGQTLDKASERLLRYVDTNKDGRAVIGKGKEIDPMGHGSAWLGPALIGDTLLSPLHDGHKDNALDATELQALLNVEYDGDKDGHLAQSEEKTFFSSMTETYVRSTGQDD